MEDQILEKYNKYRKVSQTFSFCCFVVSWICFICLKETHMNLSLCSTSHLTCYETDIVFNTEVSEVNDPHQYFYIDRGIKYNLNRLGIGVG